MPIPMYDTVEDALWLSRLVYEFLLVGPDRRTRLNDEEMVRWVATQRRLGFYERVAVEGMCQPQTGTSEEANGAQTTL